MKANAPEKIWIDNLDEGFWFDSPSGNKSIEYIRKDAFIEKACDAYCKICGHYAHKTPTYICRRACDYYKDFKQAIKDE